MTDLTEMIKWNYKETKNFFDTCAIGTDIPETKIYVDSLIGSSQTVDIRSKNEHHELTQGRSRVSRPRPCRPKRGVRRRSSSTAPSGYPKAGTSTGWNTVHPRMDSLKQGWNSPSLKRSTSDCPSVVPKLAAIFSARYSDPRPEKI